MKVLSATFIRINIFLSTINSFHLCILVHQENRAVYSFEDNCDYVYDVAWSPVHPALFAAVDGTGKLDLWNLNRDTEVPTASVLVQDLAPLALNRVSWTPNGNQVIAGDDNGKIHLYDIGEVTC